MENTKRPDGAVLTTLFAVFVLALTAFVVALRLLQQKLGGYATASLLVFALFGIFVSLYALISSFVQAGDGDLVGDLEVAVTKETPESLNRLVTMLEEQTQTLGTEKKGLEQEIFLLRGEIQALQTVAVDWADRAIEVFRMIERVLQGGDELDPGYRLAMERTKDHFAKLVSPMGVQVIEPQPGDHFDDKLHQIIGEENDPALPPWTITACEEWGYLVNGKVVLAAKVVISRRN